MAEEIKKEDHSVNKTVINITGARSVAALVLGILFTVIGIGIILLPLTPYLFKIHVEPSEPIIPAWYGGLFIGGGVLFIFNPQRLVTIISKKGDTI